MAEDKGNTGKIVAIVLAVCLGVGLIIAGIIFIPGMVMKKQYDNAVQESQERYEEAKEKAMSDYEDAKAKSQADYEEAKNKALEDYEKAKEEAQKQAGY